MQALQQLSGDALYGQGHNSELERDLVVPRRTLQRLDVSRGQCHVIDGRDRSRDLHLGDLDGGRGVEL